MNKNSTSRPKPKGLIIEKNTQPNFVSNINANKFFEDHKFDPQNFENQLNFTEVNKVSPA